ncbi:MAG: hypothetical protein ACYTEE_03430 [Planctomycetota bacterium]|jgi:hypothetical protein
MKKAIVLLLLFCVGTCFGGEGVSNESATAEETEKEMEIQLPDKDSTLYWVVRCQALEELVPHLTKRRAEFNEHLKVATDYLVSIGKAEEFASSNIDAEFSTKVYAETFGLVKELKKKNIPLTNKPLTWEDSVELSMRFVLIEGYLPTQIEGNEELAMYKEICEGKERYGKKVLYDLRTVVKKCMSIWLYLGQIDQQGGYRVFAHETKSLNQAEKQARSTQFEEEKRQIKREKQQMEQQRKWAVRNNRFEVRYNRSYRSGRYHW